MANTHGKVTPEDILEIKRLTEEGYTQAQIGDRLGLSKAGVRYHQVKLGLKASNKWHFGETAKKELDPIYKDEPEPSDIGSGQYIAVADKIVKLYGVKTGFTYETGVTSKTLTITTSYSEPFEVDLKDLVAFGNELLDVVDAITKLRANRYSL